MKHALVLCSGGLDSVTTAFQAKKLGYSPTLLFFNYSQRSLNQERKAVKYFAKKLSAKFIEIKIPNLIPKNSLTTKIKVSKSKSLKDTSAESKKWYVPQRNLIFLSIATSIAESLINDGKNSFGGRDSFGKIAIINRTNPEKAGRAPSLVSKKINIFVGFKSEGRESYPDTTPEFVSHFNKILQTSTNNQVSLKAPLIKKDKEDIILLAKSLKVETEKTFSCYSPKSSLHCGTCLACRLRKAGFYWANEKDKTKYFV